MSSWSESEVVVASTTDGVDAGVLLAEPVEHAGHDPPGRGADHAEPHVAAQLGAEARDVGPDRVELGLHPPGPGDHRRAFRSETAGVAVDELDSELALEPRDVRRDVGLDGVEGLGRARERPVLGDGHECLQLANVHASPVCHPIARSDSEHQ